MNKQNQISALVITKNEEANIERCIASLQAVADEILILDSGSTDRTVDIAQEMGATIHQTEWLGFAATKNKGHALASHDYILSVDADEELSPELIESIQQKKQEGLTKAAYSLDRHNFYLGKWIKHGGWHPDNKPRLYSRLACKWVGDHVHETLDIEADSAPELLQGALDHYSITSVEHHLSTIQRYAKLAAERDTAKGKGNNPIAALLSTAMRFVKIYFLKLGFLEGYRGFLIARYSARSRWLRHVYRKQA